MCMSNEFIYKLFIIFPLAIEYIHNINVKLIVYIYFVKIDLNLILKLLNIFL